jgi:hypothetical protein
MSGKRNNLEDFVIVEIKRARLLGRYDGQLDFSARFAPLLFQDLPNSNSLAELPSLAARVFRRR